MTAAKEEAGDKLAASYWECPCGQEPPRKPGGATPVRTTVSLREPRCPFCDRKFREEWRR